MLEAPSSVYCGRLAVMAMLVLTPADSSNFQADAAAAWKARSPMIAGQV